MVSYAMMSNVNVVVVVVVVDVVDDSIDDDGAFKP